MAKQITDMELQVALRLGDEDVRMMRNLEGSFILGTGKSVLCALSLAEVVRLIIGNSIGLED